MIACGLAAACPEHTWILVTVNAGAFLLDIDPGDWVAEAGAFPAIL